MIRIQDWMTQDIIKCHKEDVILGVVRQMAEKKVDSLLVINNHEKIVGIVTEYDILNRVVAKEKIPSKTKVRDIMTKKVITADVTSSLMEVSRKMRHYDLRRIPIVEDGRIVGVLTARDLIKIVSGD